MTYYILSSFYISSNTFFKQFFLWKKERFHSAGYQAQDLSIAGQYIRGQIGVNRFCEKSFVEPP